MRATPEMIAAAWATWHSRHGGKLGPGPAFVEAINAALAKQAEERQIIWGISQDPSKPKHVEEHR